MPPALPLALLCALISPVAALDTASLDFFLLNRRDAPDKQKYENLKVSASAFDSNLVAVNGKYLSVNWQASGGGAFAVIPLSHPGKLPDLFPLARSHTAPVLDTAFNPFNDDIVASAGEDGRVAITKIDEAVLQDAFASEGREVHDLQAEPGKLGHGRKAGHVVWSPTAEGVLASASYEVKVWDVTSMQSKAEMQAQPDMVGSMSFNFTGDGLATTCKDKKLRLFDTRQGGAPTSIADSHTGIKGARVCWMGDTNRICTTGFSRLSDRQVFLWDQRNLVQPVKQLVVDTSSGTLMPFFNTGNNVLFFAGKGDGNIRYYEYENDDLFALSEYKSSEPQRGMAFLPPRHLRVNDCEIARAYKVANNHVEAISFIVPRKSDSFQSDIYPPAPAGQAALSANDFFSGKSATPLHVNMEDQTQAPASVPRKTTLPSSVGASPAASPVHTRQPSRTVTAEPPKPAAAPIHPASSIAEAGGIVPPEPVLARQTAEPESVTSPESSTPPAAKAVAERQSSTGSNGEAELAGLKKENADLKNQLGDRDLLIRKLELQVEQLRTNAKKAREALSD